MLYLIGTGGYARQLIELAQLNGLKIDGIFKLPFWAGVATGDDESEGDPALAEYPVIRDFDRLTAAGDPRLILALEDNQDRKQALTVILDTIMEAVLDKQLSVSFPTLIHPTATVSPRARIGEGTIIQGGAVIGPDVEIGSHCIVGPGVSIGPDCILDDFVRIGPNVPLESSVAIGRGSLLAANACVVEGVKIGQWAVITSRAVVTEDVADRDR